MNLNLLLIITAVILLCMVMDGYKKGMVRSLISLISLLITCVVASVLSRTLRRDSIYRHHVAEHV